MSTGAAKKPNAKGGGKVKEVKKETGLGLSHKKEEDFGEWYSEVVVNGEMIEYYDISGCYILRPWTMSIWEIMQEFFDKEIKQMKFKNCYFPLFVSHGVLHREKDHIAGFAPEILQILGSSIKEGVLTRIPATPLNMIPATKTRDLLRHVNLLGSYVLRFLDTVTYRNTANRNQTIPCKQEEGSLRSLIFILFTKNVYNRIRTCIL